MEQEPEINNWKDAWENQAKKTYDYLMTLDEDRLIDYIKHDETDAFYQIWRAIGEKGTSQKSALILWQYLKEHDGEDYYLDRCHCSNALFKILSKSNPNLKTKLHGDIVNDKEGEEKRQKALDELKELINKKSTIKRPKNQTLTS